MAWKNYVQIDRSVVKLCEQFLDYLDSPSQESNVLFKELEDPKKTLKNTGNLSKECLESTYVEVTPPIL